MRLPVLVVLTLVGVPALLLAAGGRGTPAEAKDMLAKAVAHYRSVGRKQALADYTAKKAPFSDRDLYVFCIGTDGTIVANGAYPSFVGTSADSLRDAKGKALGKALVDAASGPDGGSVEYPHINPVTHKPEEKVSFVQKVGDDVCGVGAYK